MPVSARISASPSAKGEHSDDSARLKALQRYEISGPPSEERFDRLARLAAQLLDAPMAQLSFVGKEEHRMKASYGMEPPHRQRAQAWCARALGADAVTVIEDVAEDERTAESASATEEDLPLRFYAGAPLVTPGGHRVGVLSVFDTEPRRLTDEARRALADLADTVMDVLEQRRSPRKPEEARPRKHRKSRFTDALIDSLPGIFYLFDEEGKILRWNDRFETLTGYAPDELTQMAPLDFVAPDGRKKARRHLARLVETGSAAAEVLFQTKNGRRVPVFCTGRRIFIDGRPCMVGTGVNLSERRRTEEALRESEHRYQRLFEGAPTPMVVHREGRLVYANPAAAELVGAREPEQLVGRSVLEFVHPDFQKVVRSRVEAVYEGEKGELLEAKLTRLNGQVIEAELVGLPISYEGAPAALAVVRDVTERKRAEETLRTSERLHRQLFERANVPVVIFRPEGERILDANPAACRLYDFERQDLLGRSLQDLTDDVERGHREVQHILEHGGTRNFETIHFARDGTPLHILASCSLIEYDDEPAILLFGRNITERKRAEARTQELKSFYETILNEVPIEIAVLDAEGRYHYLNRAAISDPDLREWMIGKTDLEYARRRGRDMELYRERHEWTLELIEKKEAGQREESFRTGSGERVHVLRVEVPILDPNGDVKYIIGYSIDLTERKKYEEELIEAKEEAEEMARVKSAFLANMSHEIRTPLSTIAGFAEVLAEEADQEHHREFANTIERASTHLDATLTSVLDLSRLEADDLILELDPLDVTAQLEEGLNLFAAQARKKGLAFEIETPDEPVYAVTDEMALSRVLANLVSNALKFTDEGRVSVCVSTRGEEACIEVEDTGAGIGEEFLPQLFDDFVQEEQSSRSGSGLGLSITKRLVELMNGRIDVDSRKGEGTTFTVALPLASADSA